MLFPVSLDGAISQSQWRRPFSFPAALHLAAPSAAADGRETPGPRRFVRDDVIIQGDDGCCCDDSIASSTKRDASFNSPFVLLEQTRPPTPSLSSSCTGADRLIASGRAPVASPSSLDSNHICYSDLYSRPDWLLLRAGNESQRYRWMRSIQAPSAPVQVNRTARLQLTVILWSLLPFSEPVY